MWRDNPLVKTTSLVFGVLMLSACQPESRSAPNVKFEAPARILQARAVNTSQLRPSVRLTDGTVIVMQPTGDNSWSGTIDVVPNNTYTVVIDWIETLPAGEFDGQIDEALLLATWTDNVPVGADGAEVNLSNTNYDYSADEDGDGSTNLQERENNTNPFMAEGGDGDDDGMGDDGSTGDETDTGTTTDGTSTGGTDEVTDAGTPTDGTSTEGEGASTEGEGASTGGTDDLTDTGTTTDGSDDGDTAGSTSTAGTTDDGETDGDSTTTGGSTGGVVTKASVLVPRILPAQAPDIDGEDVLLGGQNTLVGEWANAVQFDDTGEGLWINNLMVDRPSNTEDPAVDGDQLHRWAAMHDGEYLYVVVLSDDVGLRNSDSDGLWQDDALELFIDGNYSRLSEWGDDDDFHYLIALQQQDSNLANNEFSPRIDTGPGPTSEPFDFMFSTGPGIGPDGIRFANFEQDVYELAIPIADAGITIGQPFGFELQIDDDDDGNGRDSKWGWYHESRQNGVDTDRTYLNPSVMGTLILEE